MKNSLLNCDRQLSKENFTSIKNLIYFFGVLFLLTACSQEYLADDFDNLKPSDQYDQRSLRDELQTGMDFFFSSDHIHPSILESDWWETLPTAGKSAAAMELKGAEKTTTFKDLTEVRQQNLAYWNQNIRSTQKSMSVNCPGYPVANPANDVILQSQAEVDAFGALGCNHVLGGLIIDDTNSTDKICDLSPLSNIESVGSWIIIGVTCATDLNGLNNLQSIGEIGPFGALVISNSEALKDLKALKNLKIVTGSINIVNDAVLKDLKGLSGIKEIGPGQAQVPITSSFVLAVNQNPQLKSFTGLSNLKSIAGRFIAINNDDLVNFSGLSSLEAIGTYPGAPLFVITSYIAENDNLRTLSGLSKVSSIGGYLAVYENPELNNFSGLSSLSSVGGIYIDSNAKLKNVDNLSDISSTVAELEVTNNPKLKKCCGFYNLLCSDPPVCSANGVGTYILFAGNHPDCTEANIVAEGPCVTK